MIKPLQYACRRAFLRLESVFDAVFNPRNNPFYHLGALSFFFFWVVAVSGIYLYIFFETSLEGAYRSVEYLTHEQWYLGGVARSLHRYASDAMVVVVLLHLVREFALDRYRGVRWYAWITGAVLLVFLYVSGIGGYWLVWDRLAQYIAIATSEWLDWLPLFSEPMARNFLNSVAMNNRFFSLLSFMHIGIPLFLLLGMWIHIQRISQPKTNPPRELVVGSLLAMTVLAFVRPALSQAPADLDSVVGSVQLDWFYLALYPPIDFWSPGAVWGLTFAGGLLLLLLPWLPRKISTPVAVVDLPNCNGCGRCFADCPYSAVIMQPRTDGLPFENQAAVDPDLCTRCGICVGACPTATPFRRITEITPGIDMPALTVREMRARTLAATAPLTGSDRVMVYVCGAGPNLAAFSESGVAVLTLPCVGALPPSFIDFVISRRHADGVALVGCVEGDCYQRFGVEWTGQRIAGQRDPALRSRVPRARVAMCWAGPGGLPELRHQLATFRGTLRERGPYQKGEAAYLPAENPEQAHNVSY